MKKSDGLAAATLKKTNSYFIYSARSKFHSLPYKEARTMTSSVRAQVHFFFLAAANFKSTKASERKRRVAA